MGRTSYYLDVSAGNAGTGTYSVNKFGHNDEVSTSPIPVTHGGIYRTPQVSSATKLRIKAGNVNDSTSGTGARAVILDGLDANGNRVTEEIPTNGTSAGALSVNTYIRLYRAYVSKSGTYGTASVNSHAADIVIENAAGTQNWATIDLDAAGFADGQTEIEAYTVPKGKNAYMTSFTYAVDTNKVTSLFFYKRENILQTAAPYSSIRKQFGIQGAIRDNTMVFEPPLRFDELTDIGVLAFVNTGTAAVSVQFDLLIRDKE